MGNIRRMFFGGNTSNGFYSLHDNIINEKRKKQYILKGMPGGGKSSLMRKIGDYFHKENYTVEFHHCPTDPDSLDSILIRELRTAIVDGTAPHVIEPVYPGLKDQLVDLAVFIDRERLKAYEKEVMEAKAANRRAYFNVFSYLKAARHIHDIIVEKNKQGVDFEGLDKKARLVIEEIFSQKEVAVEEDMFKERHAFSTANTPKGLVDYTDTILNGIGNVYYIRGERGTGKATLIKKVYDMAVLRGYTLEVYRDSMFPEKFETIIIKELDTCVTSNKNGEKLASSIVDLNEYFDDRVMDRRDYDLYDLLVENATLNLQEASKNHNIMEKIYIPTIDYGAIDEVKDSILNEILALI